MFSKVSFEDWFQHCAHCGFHHPVAHRRDAQRPLLATARLGYPFSSQRLRTITAVFQGAREMLQVGFQVLLEHLDGLIIHTGGSFVRLHSRKGTLQIRRAVNLINQTEPFASFNSLFESCQHPFAPDCRFPPTSIGHGLLQLV